GLSAINPVKIATIPLTNGIRDMVVSAGCLYTANTFPTPSGVSVFDVSNPAQPAATGYTDRKDYAVAVAVQGMYLYAIYSDGLAILSISDPTNPVPAGQISGRWSAVTV